MEYRISHTVVPEHACLAAVKLNSQSNASLSIAVSEMDSLADQGNSNLPWKISDGQIIFSSLEARNFCVAVAAYRKLQGANGNLDPLEVFVIARQLRNDDDSQLNTACGQFLSIVDDEVDVLLAAAALIETGQCRVFDILESVEAAIPYLINITPTSLIALVKAQHPKTKLDLMHGKFLSVVENYLNSHSQFAWEVHNLLRPYPEETTNSLYCSASFSLTGSAKDIGILAIVLADARSQNISIAICSIRIIARVLSAKSVPLEIAQEYRVILRDMLNHSHENIWQAAAQGVAQAATSDLALIDELFRNDRSSDQFTLSVLADFIFRNLDALNDSDRLPSLIRRLVHLQKSSTGGLQNFDWSLTSIYTRGTHKNLVIECISIWITINNPVQVRDTDSIEVFEQAISKISEDDSDLAKLITNWLLSDAPQLGAACGGLISRLSTHTPRNLEFSKEVLNQANEQDLTYLVRRMLGFVISERALISLTFSLLNTIEPQLRTFGLVLTLLSREIGRDYVRETQDAIVLRAQIGSSDEKALLETVSTDLSAYVKKIDDLPRLPELRPPTQLRRTIKLNRDRAFQADMVVARETSIFSQISTRIPIKAGKGWFTTSSNELGATHNLQKISSEITFPRRAISDPVGFEISGLMYRLAKRGNE